VKLVAKINLYVSPNNQRNAKKNICFKTEVIVILLRVNFQQFPPNFLPKKHKKLAFDRLNQRSSHNYQSSLVGHVAFL
jgi:hypothetical protein